jgi:hypothetical protein
MLGDARGEGGGGLITQRCLLRSRGSSAIERRVYRTWCRWVWQAAAGDEQPDAASHAGPRVHPAAGMGEGARG